MTEAKLDRRAAMAALVANRNNLLVVPGLAITYLACGPHRWVKRLGQLFAAAAALVVSAGWWILIVELWPANSRPYIGGSPSNSILELTLGYNGIGRLNGDEHGSVRPGGAFEGAGFEGFGGGRGGGGFGGFGGETGWLRMFDSSQGGQIAWLPPEPDIRYSLFYRNVSILPRPDGTVVQQVGDGEMFGYGISDETPDRAEAETAIATIAPLFGSNFSR